MLFYRLLISCFNFYYFLQMKDAENAQRRLRFSAEVYHHLCAVKIQRAFRAHQALKAARKQMHSVIYIQVCTLE